jgi:hypothetical protein
MRNVVIRFECGQEDRIGADLGPFEYAQMTYGCLMVDDAGTVLADYVDGWWITPDGQKWSDFIISAWGDHETA